MMTVDEARAWFMEGAGKCDIIALNEVFLLARDELKRRNSQFARKRWERDYIQYENIKVGDIVAMSFRFRGKLKGYFEVLEAAPEFIIVRDANFPSAPPEKLHRRFYRNGWWPSLELTPDR
jgi:hypothetical protein